MLDKTIKKDKIFIDITEVFQFIWKVFEANIGVALGA